MGKFNNDRRPGGRGGFGGGRGRDRGRPEMHRATCAECGNGCEVPFKPTGEKPVYCSDCFGGNSGGRDSGRRDSGRRDFGRRDSGRRDFGERRMHNAICEGCGDKCQVPFKPSGDKPVYCDACFGGGAKSPIPQKSEVSKEMIDELNGKLDKIITLLQRTNPVKEITVMKKKAEEETDGIPESMKKEKAEKKPATKKTATKKTPAKKAATKKKATAKKKPAAKKKK